MVFIVVITPFATLLFKPALYSIVCTAIFCGGIQLKLVLQIFPSLYRIFTERASILRKLSPKLSFITGTVPNILFIFYLDQTV